MPPGKAAVLAPKASSRPRRAPIFAGRADQGRGAELARGAASGAAQGKQPYTAPSKPPRTAPFGTTYHCRRRLAILPLRYRSWRGQRDSCRCARCCKRPRADPCFSTISPLSRGTTRRAADKSDPDRPSPKTHPRPPVSRSRLRRPTRRSPRSRSGIRSAAGPWAPRFATAVAPKNAPYTASSSSCQSSISLR